MKGISQLVSLMVLVVLVGCSTPNRTAYVTLDSIAISVNTSLKVYNDFYQAGKSDEVTREKIKGIYEKYQAAARVAQTAQKNISDPTSDAYQQVTAIVQSVATELTEQINKEISKK